jgi:hypothetical protein
MLARGGETGFFGVFGERVGPTERGRAESGLGDASKSRPKQALEQEGVERQDREKRSQGGAAGVGGLAFS